MPVYVPLELFHAQGALPVGILGGGDQLEIIRGDAYYQSYICHIPDRRSSSASTGRSTARRHDLPGDLRRDPQPLRHVEDALPGQPGSRYLDVPQNFDPGRRRPLLPTELESHRARARGGAEPRRTRSPDERLRSSHRAVQRAPPRGGDGSTPSEPSGLRGPSPPHELYCSSDAGRARPARRRVEPRRCSSATAAGWSERRSERRPDGPGARAPDRLVLRATAARPHQDPRALRLLHRRRRLRLRSTDRSSTRSSTRRRPVAAPWSRPSSTIRVASPVRYIDEETKGADAAGTHVRRSGAEGVLFCAPSFCDPALLDQPMLRPGGRGGRHPVDQPSSSPRTTRQFQVIREQAGTFSDSIKLWSESSHEP